MMIILSHPMSDNILWSSVVSFNWMENFTLFNPLQFEGNIKLLFLLRVTREYYVLTKGNIFKLVE